MDKEGKANDSAITALQQLVTVASGILLLSITFIKDIVGDADYYHFFLIRLGWCLLTFSIWMGWVSLASMAKLIHLSKDGEYVFANKSGSRTRVKLAQYSLLAGLTCITLFALINFNYQPSKKIGSKPVVNNFYAASTVDAGIYMDSLGTISGFTEGKADRGFDAIELDFIKYQIEKKQPVSLFVFGEVDKREIQSQARDEVGSNISLARGRAEFIKGKLFSLCKERDINILTFSNGAYHIGNHITAAEMQKDRRVVIYGVFHK